MESSICTDRLLTRVEAAGFLRLARQTLAKWACEGKGPRYIHIGRRPVYRESDLAAFLAANTREPAGGMANPTAAPSPRQSGG